MEYLDLETICSQKKRHCFIDIVNNQSAPAREYNTLDKTKAGDNEIAMDGIETCRDIGVSCRTMWKRFPLFQLRLRLILAYYW